MMDLDELKEKWMELDRKLDVNIRLNQQLLSATKLNQTRSSLKRLAVYTGLEATAWLAIIVAQFPIVRVNPHADGQIVKVFRALHNSDLIRRVGFRVAEVRRAKERGRAACD